MRSKFKRLFKNVRKCKIKQAFLFCIILDVIGMCHNTDKNILSLLAKNWLLLALGGVNSTRVTLFASESFLSHTTPIRGRDVSVAFAETLTGA